MLTLEKKGRRIYLRGVPYSLRGKAKDIGAKWDPDEGSWWIGAGKAAMAERLAVRLADLARAETPETVARDARIIQGSARYKGRVYRILAQGRDRTKLCFRDGSKTFWVDETQLADVKHYMSPKTIGELEAWASRQTGEAGACRECHQPIRHASHHRAMEGLCGACAFDEFDI